MFKFKIECITLVLQNIAQIFCDLFRNSNISYTTESVEQFSATAQHLVFMIMFCVILRRKL